MNEIMAGTDPTENLKKKPRKSILKSSSSFEVPEAPAGSKRKNTQHQHKETKWDEDNIKETLHPPNKDYGHMKIEEPKTPYERLVKDEVDARGVDPAVLAEKLQKNLQKKKSRTGSAKSTGSTSSAGSKSKGGNRSDSSDDETVRKKDFESKRKAHYNEFLAAKEALKNLKDDEDEDE